MDNPTEEQVINLLCNLPFPCYFGKGRDGVLEVHIPIKEQNMKVYLIDDRQLDYQEPTMTATGEYISDEEFIEIAEQDGTVYSLDCFQKQWNSNELFEQYGEDLNNHWIRIL